MAAAIDEEALILKVIEARTDLDVTTNPELLKLLESDFAGLTLSLVKKANSKAAKRTGGAVAKPAADTVPAAAAPLSKRQEKAKAAEEKAAAAELKSAEATMMEMQRRLRAAKDGDPASQVTVTGTAEQFIQGVTQRAITGQLDKDDEPFLKERIEADITALEWVKLAQASGALSLTEDVLALGVHVQLERLKEVRGAKDVTAARAVFIDAKPTREAPATDATADLDARVKAAAAEQQATGEIDEMD